MSLEYASCLTMKKICLCRWTALSGLYSQQLPNTVQVNEATETKHLFPGHLWISRMIQITPMFYWTMWAYCILQNETKQIFKVVDRSKIIKRN